MNQLEKLKLLLGSPPESDLLLQLLLDNAGEIICDIRNTDVVEPKYLGVQVSMAVEMYNKRGAEGQTGHSENGISRSYERGDISDAIMSKVTPRIKTTFSQVKVVE